MVPTITPSTRRNLRKRRAVARHRWFLFRTGQIPLNRHQLQRLRTTLQQHHSRDLNFLRIIVDKMEQYPVVSWRCRLCPRYCPGGADFCGGCGKHWKQCYDKSFQGHPQEVARYYGGQKHDPSKSPRRRRPKKEKKDKEKPQSPRPRNPKPKEDGYQEPPPPWIGNSAAPAPPPPAPAPHPAEAQFRNLVKELKKGDMPLTPAIQKMVEDSTLQQQQDDTKALHSAVAKLGQARKSLALARTARATHHQKWSEFLGHSVSRWQGWVKEFTEKDCQLEQQIASAHEGLTLAKERLGETKRKATSSAEDLQEDVDDEDMVQQSDASAMLRQGMEGMVTNLQALKSKADAAIEEQESKRLKPTPPTEPGGEETKPPVDQLLRSSPALQPFAKAGQ